MSKLQAFADRISEVRLPVEVIAAEARALAAEIDAERVGLLEQLDAAGREHARRHETVRLQAQDAIAEADARHARDVAKLNDDLDLMAAENRRLREELKAAHAHAPKQEKTKS